LSIDEYAKRQQELEAIKRAHEAKRRVAYADASKKAEKLFKEALNASDDHPYLARKRVKGYGIKQKNSFLLIPVYSVLGEFQSVQFIDERGNKKFLKGGKVSGGCHFIGDISEGKPIYIAEGYATAASVYEDTQCLTIVAFNAGNLINVAKDIKKNQPRVAIVIAGDCDPVGNRYADEASKAVNGTTLIPDFGKNPQGYTDWNDYFNFGVQP
jgi:putative DNA primase/helicase